MASAGIRSSETVLDVGTSTGILLPIIQTYSPARIYAHDLPKAMLDSVIKSHPTVHVVKGNVRDADLKDGSIDVVFINACYSSITDKHKAFDNIGRMMRSGGRLIISHPLGRPFIAQLKSSMPFPLDDFPADRRPAESAKNWFINGIEGTLKNSVSQRESLVAGELLMRS